MSEPTVKAEIAAGGLVWDMNEAVPRLGLVHRAGYRDWTLPKGKFERDQDHSLEETARREVKEEMGCDVEIQEIAGVTQYEKGGSPKIVLFWSMVRVGRFDPRPNEEIDSVAWLPVDDAIGRLTHANERDLVARQGRQALRVLAPPAETRRWYLAAVEFIAEPFRTFTSLGPRLDRLRVAVETLSARVQAGSRKYSQGAMPQWLDAATKILRQADAASRSGKVDVGWGHILEAERFVVLGLDDDELIQRAITLRVEAKRKLKGWRRDAVEELFAAERVKTALSAPRGSLDEGSRQIIEKAVFEGLWVLHGHYNNTYYRIRLARRQLFVLFGFLLFLLSLFFWWLDHALVDPRLDVGLMPYVALFGGLGAVLSAVLQISRSAGQKIPESILHGMITAGRPLVGAASALFLYMALQSGLVNFIDASKIGEATYLTLAFVAGFSERLVLKTVGQLEGPPPEEKPKPRG